MSTTDDDATDTHAEPASILNDAVEALVALAAAVASNGAETFRARYGAAVKLGASQDDLLTVIKVAQRVKSQASREMLELAEHRLRGEDEEEHGCGRGGCCGDGGCKKKGGCCGDEGGKKKGGCCG